MDKAEMNNAHKRMMRGLEQEHASGSLSDAEYARFKARALEAHKADLASLRPQRASVSKRRTVRITPPRPRIGR